MKIRVYVVDSHALIRHGLVSVIGGQTDMEVCGEAGNASTALNAIAKLQPDVVTVEVWLKDNSGLELTKSIKANNPRIGILVLSMYDETVYAFRVLKAGALGFVSKHDNTNKVVDAIRRVGNRKLYLSADIENQVLTRVVDGETAESSSVSGLSDREFEIGNLIGSGLLTREIAGRLHVSVKTVESHRSHMKEKLGLPNATRLQQFWVRWVDHQGLTMTFGHPAG